MSASVSHMPAREIIGGDVIMFADGTEADVVWTGFGDEKEHGLVTYNGKIALPWMIGIRTVEKPVRTHPAQTFRVRRVSATSHAPGVLKEDLIAKLALVNSR